MAGEFTGRVVVLTGAAGGFGTALCDAFVAEGARVVALDNDAESLDNLAASTRLDAAHRLDITDGAAVEAVFDEIGRVDVLVNNAGVTALGRFSDIDPSSFERVMAVNLTGAANCTRSALPALLASHGRIGVMSSVAGFSPLVHRTAYAASKHALHGLFESLRSELVDTGVTVTMICPSFAATGIQHRAVRRGEDQTGDWSTTGKLLTPEEVAASTVEGLRTRARLVLPSRTAKLAYVVSRIAPRRYEQIMRNRVIT